VLNKRAFENLVVRGEIEMVCTVELGKNIVLGYFNVFILNFKTVKVSN
jgi:hypothetical protein